MFNTMKNTKLRHQEIYAAAAKALDSHGGVERIDSLDRDERRPILRQLAIRVKEQTGCTRDTARRNVAKAMRRARFAVMQKKEPLIKDNWGGARPNTGTGPHPLLPGTTREKVSTRLAPGSKELAQAIAEILELPGWGHALEVALVRLVEGDWVLRRKLAEMGIIVKGGK